MDTERDEDALSMKDQKRLNFSRITFTYFLGSEKNPVLQRTNSNAHSTHPYYQPDPLAIPPSITSTPLPTSSPQLLFPPP